LTAGAYVVVVALGAEAPDLATLRAFVVERGVAVSYRPGVWHHPMIAVEAVTDFACLVWEDGTAEDAVVHALNGAQLALERPSLARPAVAS
jgi:ureidoglycolate lyase